MTNKEEVVVTGRKKGEIINELEEAEEKFKDALIPFLRSMFTKFYENKEIFTRAV